MDTARIRDFSERLLSLAVEFRAYVTDDKTKIESQLDENIYYGFLENFKLRQCIPKENQTKSIKSNKEISAYEKELNMLKLKIKGLSVGKTPRSDGRFQGRYYEHDDDLKPQYVYADTYEECCKKLLDRISGKVKPKKQKTNLNISLSEWLTFWYNNYKKPKLKALSQKSLENTISLLNRLFGGKKLKNLTTDEIQQALVPIAETRNRTAHMALNELSRAYKKAIETRRVKENPCIGVELKRVQAEHHPAFTVSDQAIFFHEAKYNKHYFLLKLLLSTGLRVGEALALRHDDINIGIPFGNVCRNYINVTKDVVWINGHRIDQPFPKTKKSIRQAIMTDELVKIYSELYPVLENRSGLLFTITYDGISSAFERLIKKTNLTGNRYTIHSLRSTFNTRLGEKGVPDKVRQELMGHDEQKMTTDTYNAGQIQFIMQYFDEINHTFDTNFDTKKDK